MKNRQYKDDAEEHDLEKRYPDPPFIQATYDAMLQEVADIRKTMISPKPLLREIWISKNGGGSMTPAGIAVNPHEYPRLAKKWSQFTEWEAKREYAKKKELEDLAKVHEAEINKL